MIRWTDLAGASVKTKPEDKRQVATIRFKRDSKTVTVGGAYNVFPKRADVERFVEQVNSRASGN